MTRALCLLLAVTCLGPPGYVTWFSTWQNMQMIGIDWLVDYPECW